MGQPCSSPAAQQASKTLRALYTLAAGSVSGALPLSPLCTCSPTNQLPNCGRWWLSSCSPAGVSR